MLTILAWIVLGGAVGWLASRLSRGTSLGVVGDMLLGMIGAVVFGLVMALLLPGARLLSNVSLGAWLVGLGGAALLLFLMRAMGMSVRSSGRR